MHPYNITKYEVTYVRKVSTTTYNACYCCMVKLSWGYNTKGGSNGHSNHADHMIIVSSLSLMVKLAIPNIKKNMCDTPKLEHS